jgi:RHS repeat-associated protein
MKLKQTYKIIFNLQVSVFILLCHLLTAQQALVPDILPSADATALGKHGSFPVSYHTGQASIGLPLTSIASHGMNIDFGLSYDGSGIMVDQHPGWVGQNWSLNGGGVITRTVNGAADEEGGFAGDGYYNNRIAYFYNVNNFGPWFNEANTDTYQELINLTTGRWFGIPISGGSNTNGYVIDTEPDIFSFSFMGMDGKFFMDQNGKWKIISEHNLRVILDVIDTSNYQDPIFVNGPHYGAPFRYDKVLKGFKMMDDNGNTYTFGFKPNAIEYSLPFFRQYSNDGYFDYPNWIANAWYLTKVEDIKGHLSFDLDYERSYFTANIQESFSSSKQGCYVEGGIPPFLFPPHWPTNSVGIVQGGTGSLISPVYLKSVKNFIGDKIVFKKSNADQLKFQWLFPYTQQVGRIQTDLCGYPGCGAIPFPYLQTPNYQYSFDHVAALNINPVEGLKWQKLDSILTYRNNNHLVGAIKLNYNNISTQRLNLQSVDFLASDAQTNPSVGKYSYSMEYNDFEQLPPYNSRMTDHFGYYNGTAAYSPPTFPIDYPSLETLYYASRNSSEPHLLKGQLKKIFYPTGGRTEFEFESHSYSEIVSNDRQSMMAESGIIGGLRIKKIHNFGDNSATPSTTKTYHYKKNFATGGNNSSGILALKPKYVWIDWVSPSSRYPAGGYTETSWSNNILIPLGNKFESHIGYADVVEQNLDNSYTIYKYTSHSDIKDELPYANLNLAYSPYARFSDKSHMRGKLVERLDYNANNTIVKSVQNYYDNPIGQQGFNEYGIDCNTKVYSFFCDTDDARFTGNAIKIFYNKFLIDSTITKYHYGGNIVSTKETMQYARPNIHDNKYAFLMQRSIINSDGKVYMDYFKYPFDHTSSYAGQQSLMTQLTNSHRLSSVYSERKVNGTVIDIRENLYALFDGKPMVSNIKRRECTWDVNGTLQCNDDDEMFIDNYNMVYLIPTQRRQNGWMAENLSLTYRGMISGWSFVNHSKGYNYYSNDYLQTYTDIDGQQKVFQYDLFNRVKKTTLLPKNVFIDYRYHYSTSPTDRSYFKAKTKYPLSADSALDSVVQFSYVDGLGRAIQSNHKYGAPDGADVITQTEYDNVGRTYRSYEAIAVSGNDGAYYTGTFGGGYTQQLYEPNPLDRPSQNQPPAWQPTNHTYGTNTTAFTNPEGQVYAINSLMRTTSTDPDGLSTDVYTDKLGRAVLERQRDASNTTDTWTVYDDKSRPVKIYPPGSSPATPGLIYEFRYDGDDNVVYKKVPDAAAEEYRYSVRNLQTAMRNAVLQTQGKWLVTRYDVYGRPTQRGYHNGSDPGTSEIATIHTLLEVYHYDGFNGATTNTAPIYKGKLKKSRIKVLEDTGSNANWVETEYYYDIYGRVSLAIMGNHLGGGEVKSYTYDFADNVTLEGHGIGGANGIGQDTRHTYDAQGRKVFDKIILNSGVEVTTSQCVYDHKSQIIERNLGRHSTTGTHQYLQSLDYTYNAQGWLTGINTLLDELIPCCFDPCDGDVESFVILQPFNNNTDEQDLFAQGIDYNTTLAGSGIPARQNGNITALKWWHRGQYNQSYTYRYDHLNRVTEAKHGEIITGTHTLKNQYNEKIEYDPRGNITKLNRKGMVQRPDIDGNCFKTVTIDSLTYIYDNGTNKLVQVIDNAPCMDTITLPAVIDRDVNYAAGQLIRIANTDVLCNVNMNLTAGTEIKILDTLHLPNSCGTPALVIAYQGPCPQDKYTEGFNQQSLSGQYTYDTGGNMNYDPNKKHTFYYNHLNLPYRIVGAENDKIEFLYSADGTMLQRKYIKNNVEISKIDYLRGKEIINGELKNIYFSDGRIVKTGTTFDYEYAIKDHLGNIRVTFADDNNNGLIIGSEIRSRNDYYAFGMEWDNYWQIGEFSDPENRYKYNGKELVEEMGLNLLDYHARQMDPILGRFMSVDILSSEFPGWSGYSYVHNNPILLTDPTGMKADSTPIYNLSGAYQFTINDKLPNESHFLSEASIKDLVQQCCNSSNEEGEYARSISAYYIGKNTISQIQSIYTNSSKDDNGNGLERGFALYLDGKSKELSVRDITHSNFRTNRSFNMGSAITYSTGGDIVPIAHGHTHLYNFHATSPEDFQPLMKNPFTGKMGGHPTLISHKKGIKVYSSFELQTNGDKIYKGRYGLMGPIINY